MATLLSTAAAILMSARIVQQFRYAPVWRPVTMDLSAELQDFGKAINLTMDVSDYEGETVDYVVGTDHKDPDEVSVRNEQLEVDQQKLLIFQVDDIEAKQIRIPALSNMAMRQVEEHGRGISKFIRKKVDDGIVTSAVESAATAGSYLKGAEKVREDSLSVTVANWGKEAHREAVEDKILQMASNAEKWYWRGDFFMVITPEYKKFLIQQLLAKGAIFVSGISDESYTNYEILRAYGFYPIVDPDISKGVSGGATPTNTQDASFNMYFGVKNNGIAFAMQLGQLETFRSHKRVSTVVRTTYTFGSTLEDRLKVGRVLTSIT